MDETQKERAGETSLKVDHHCALDVSRLNKGMRPFEVRRPKFKEECPEASVREGPEELMLRAEEVGSQKSCINVGHIADRWGPPLVDADWHASCQAVYKGHEWEEVYEHDSEMSKAAGVRKPHESQKAGALGKMKAARDSGEFF